MAVTSVEHTAAEARLLNQIVAALSFKRAGRSHAKLAQEIGISRPMLRYLDLNGVRPGLDTLAYLVAWDEPTFGPLAASYLKQRGTTLRKKIAA